MSCGAATQVNVTSLYFFLLDKRTRQRRARERERGLRGEVRFCYNSSYLLLHGVCQYPSMKCLMRCPNKHGAKFHHTSTVYF